MSERIESFRELNVYKLALELQQEIFLLTKRFPKEYQVLLGKCKRIGKMLGKMMAEPEKWCKRFLNN